VAWRVWESADRLDRTNIARIPSLRPSGPRVTLMKCIDQQRPCSKVGSHSETRWDFVACPQLSANRDLVPRLTRLLIIFKREIQFSWLRGAFASESIRDQRADSFRTNLLLQRSFAEYEKSIRSFVSDGLKPFVGRQQPSGFRSTPSSRLEMKSKRLICTRSIQSGILQYFSDIFMIGGEGISY